MLCIKDITDTYGNRDDFAPPVVIPAGASFRDMVAMKGTPDIGDRINTAVIQPLIDANARLARSDFPDFTDPNKLGDGKERVDRLTNLVAIFQKPELDVSQNRAEHDDIRGDAYEYLMRHFASESGKSKGPFYTPAAVSRVIAPVIGIAPHTSRASTTVDAPTCVAGSLLRKVAAQSGTRVTLEGSATPARPCAPGGGSRRPRRRKRSLSCAGFRSAAWTWTCPRSSGSPRRGGARQP